MKKYFLLLLLFTACGKKNDPVTPTDDNRCLSLTAADAEAIAIFPATHPLNTAVDAMDTDPKSDSIVAFITKGSNGLKADFGSGLYEGAPIGIPFVVVCKDQTKVPVVFRGNDYDDDYGDQSEPGPYPIPLSSPIEGNGEGDSHVLAVDVDNKLLYELYNAEVAGQSWEASCGVVWDLSKEMYRQEGWTSADAAGLPIFPLLVRYDEVASGTIDHAIRFTLPKPKVMRGYVFPASHVVNGGNKNPNDPTPFGMRLRLKKNFDISGFSPANQVILTGMKKYGIILADIGSSFYITGAPDDRWDNDDLQDLKQVKGSDFEVVTLGKIGTGD